MPAQFGVNARTVAAEFSWFTYWRPPAHGNWPPGDPLSDLDYLAYAHADPAADVIDAMPGGVGNVERRGIGPGQVADVGVLPDRRAVTVDVEAVGLVGGDEESLGDDP